MGINTNQIATQDNLLNYMGYRKNNNFGPASKCVTEKFIYDLRESGDASAEARAMCTQVQNLRKGTISFSSFSGDVTFKVAPTGIADINYDVDPNTDATFVMHSDVTYTLTIKTNSRNNFPHINGGYLSLQLTSYLQCSVGTLYFFNNKKIEPGGKTYKASVTIPKGNFTGASFAVDKFDTTYGLEEPAFTYTLTSSVSEVEMDYYYNKKLVTSTRLLKTAEASVPILFYMKNNASKTNIDRIKTSCCCILDGTSSYNDYQSGNKDFNQIGGNRNESDIIYVAINNASTIGPSKVNTNKSSCLKILVTDDGNATFKQYIKIDCRGKTNQSLGTLWNNSIYNTSGSKSDVKNYTLTIGAKDLNPVSDHYLDYWKLLGTVDSAGNAITGIYVTIDS